MLKKLLALAMTIIFIFSFSGCGGTKTNTIPVFEEKDMGKASGLNLMRGIKINSKDQLVIYTVDDKGEGRYAILDKDGKEVSSIKCDFAGDGYFFTLDENDNLYVLVQSFTMDEAAKKVKEIARQVIMFDANGVKQKTTDLGKIIPEGGYSGLSGFEIDSAGNIYLLEQSKYVEVFDKEGRGSKNIGTQGYSCMCMDPAGYLILGSDGQGGGNNKRTIDKFKMPGGESVWKKDPGYNDTPNMIRYNRNDKCIYTLTDRGIKKYSADGSDNGNVLDIKQTSLSGFNSWITGMDMDSSGCYYFTVSKNAGTDGPGQTGFYKYAPAKENTDVKEKNTAAIEQKTLTFSTMDLNRYLENAISEFQKANPDIKIEVKECPTIYNRDDFNKYITTLNSELMSDKGSDLISVSRLPNYKYISKGVFANLSDMLAKDKEIDLKQYNTKLFDSFKYKGNMYVMPISVFMETIVVNQSILDKENIIIDDTKWTWKDFLEICKKVTKDTNGDGTPEQYALPYIPNSNLLYKIFSNNAVQFIDRENKKATLDSPDFINLLKLVKEYSDSNVNSTEKNTTNMNNALFDLYDRNGVVFIPATIYAYGTMGFFGENTSFLRPPSVNGTYKPVYNTWMMLAINEKSKYKEEAWKFVKFMISKDMQTPRELNGFVVNREAEAIRWKEEVDNTKSGNSKGFSGRRILPMTETTLDAANRLLDITGFMPDYDEQLIEIISIEADQFFTGVKSAEAAAKAMQSKINTYLNE
jgi:ABC-type glycerol-3-phosphate transport system substrate-binding protein